MKNQTDILGRLDEERRMVNLEIQKTLVGKPDRLYSAARHLCLAGGKKVRPMLCILSCRAVGGATEQAVRTSAAIELIHTFTLIHDDIMDNDEMRRGKPSVHKTYGLPTAILAGDLLYAKGYEICDPKTVYILAKATSEICEGQELDMSFEERADVSEADYMEMIEKKTAVLLRAAAESGAVIGGATEKQAKSLASYGLNLGLAFQMQDDILGVTADEEKLGKPVGSDIVEGKKSLIAIKAIEKLPATEKKELLKILHKKGNSETEINRAVELFHESGAIDYCRKKAEEYVKNAKDSLKDLPKTESREDLYGIAEYVIKREL